MTEKKRGVVEDKDKKASSSSSNNNNNQSMSQAGGNMDVDQENKIEEKGTKEVESNLGYSSSNNNTNNNGYFQDIQGTRRGKCTKDTCKKFMPKQNLIECTFCPHPAVDHEDVDNPTTNPGNNTVVKFTDRRFSTVTKIPEFCLHCGEHHECSHPDVSGLNLNRADSGVLGQLGVVVALPEVYPDLKNFDPKYNRDYFNTTELQAAVQNQHEIDSRFIKGNYGKAEESTPTVDYILDQIKSRDVLLKNRDSSNQNTLNSSVSTPSESSIISNDSDLSFIGKDVDIIEVIQQNVNEQTSQSTNLGIEEESKQDSEVMEMDNEHLETHSTNQESAQTDIDETSTDKQETNESPQIDNDETSTDVEISKDNGSIQLGKRKRETTLHSPNKEQRTDSGNTVQKSEFPMIFLIFVGIAMGKSKTQIDLCRRRHAIFIEFSTTGSMMDVQHFLAVSSLACNNRGLNTRHTSKDPFEQRAWEDRIGILVISLVVARLLVLLTAHEAKPITAEQWMVMQINGLTTTTKLRSVSDLVLKKYAKIGLIKTYYQELINLYKTKFNQNVLILLDESQVLLNIGKNLFAKRSDTTVVNLSRNLYSAVVCYLTQDVTGVDLVLSGTGIDLGQDIVDIAISSSAAKPQEAEQHVKILDKLTWPTKAQMSSLVERIWNSDKLGQHKDLLLEFLPGRPRFQFGFANYFSQQPVRSLTYMRV
eukprot:TRINITY_DN636_c2_g1_i2.p1 TRINITY_DN636_c2_g1~~TRINITY_DN636_c2_g1_i2.p1  ORF type:complete len:704 (-),score=104.64 TRINITY_DN636_c2_g1_i2:122-2233(-)